ncbi:MAG: hypothetical protein GY777_32105 [Candidatus Brocadiaceae bacterium]|nr:hypothetical protein [Candidatus Brocadiaceae bacterium]
MKRILHVKGLTLCGVLLLAAASSVLAKQPGEEEITNLLSTSDHYKLKIRSKKLDFKCSAPYSNSNRKNFQGISWAYVQDSILVPRVIRVTKGESPVIILQVGNDIIYYHNYFRIVIKN